MKSKFAFAAAHQIHVSGVSVRCARVVFLVGGTSFVWHVLVTFLLLFFPLLASSLSLVTSVSRMNERISMLRDCESRVERFKIHKE